MSIVVNVVIAVKVTPINRQMILIAVGRDQSWMSTIAVVDITLKFAADEADIKSCAQR
jgi:hypothetical protein